MTQQEDEEMYGIKNSRDASLNRRRRFSSNFNISVKSVEDYVELEKKDREYFGFYKKPYSLPVDLDERLCSFDKFSDFVKNEYPIQWFFREYLFSLDNPIYYVFWKCSSKISDFRYAVRNFFSSFKCRFYKANPRHVYCDPCELIVKVNFAILLDFYYLEVVNGHVDWMATEEHRDFYEWLVACVKDIEDTIPELDKEQDRGYDLAAERKGVEYTIRYKEVNDAERRKEEITSDILSGMVKYRQFFWT